MSVKKHSKKSGDKTSKVDASIYDKFGKQSKEKAKKKARELDGNKVPMGKFAPNKTTRLKFMPPLKGQDEFYLDSSVHWGWGEDGKAIRTCKKVFGKKCKQCEKVSFLRDVLDKIPDTQENSKKIKKFKGKINSISARRNILAYGADIDNLKAGIQKWPVPKGSLSDMLDYINDKCDGEDLITDPKKGHIVEIKRKGSGQFDTEYKTSIGEEWPTPVKILKDLLDCPPLVLKEIEKDDDLDEIIEDTMANFEDLFKAAKVKYKPTKAKDEDDEEDDDDDEEDDEEDDDEDPDEDDEETDDEEDDDEDPDEEEDDDEDSDDDEDDDEDESDDEDSDDDEDDDESDDDEDEDEDDEEDEYEKKKKSVKSSKKTTKSSSKKKRK